jgi:hypothetical protein
MLAAALLTPVWAVDADVIRNAKRMVLHSLNPAKVKLMQLNRGLLYLCFIAVMLFKLTSYDVICLESLCVL